MLRTSRMRDINDCVKDITRRILEKTGDSIINCLSEFTWVKRGIHQMGGYIPFTVRKTAINEIVKIRDIDVLHSMDIPDHIAFILKLDNDEYIVVHTAIRFSERAQRYLYLVTDISHYGRQYTVKKYNKYAILVADSEIIYVCQKYCSGFGMKKDGIAGDIYINANIRNSVKFCIHMNVMNRYVSITINKDYMDKKARVIFSRDAIPCGNNLKLGIYSEGDASKELHERINLWKDDDIIFNPEIFIDDGFSGDGNELTEDIIEEMFAVALKMQDLERTEEIGIRFTYNEIVYPMAILYAKIGGKYSDIVCDYFALIHKKGINAQL